MKLAIPAAALMVAAIGWSPALAQGSLEERLEKMEQRIQYLEERLAVQDQVIAEKKRTIARLSEQEDAWFNGVEVGGAVELEAVYENPEGDDGTTDAAVATVEFGIAAQLDDQFSGEVVLSYNNEDEDIEVDTATLTMASPDESWAVTAGQLYVPFGSFETGLVSDPLTLEIGETREIAVTVDAGSGGFSTSVFGFKGDSDPDARLDGFGATVGYEMEADDTGFNVNVGYISDIGESDGLAFEDDDRMAGWFASGAVSMGGITLSGEYVGAATDATHVDDDNELVYGFKGKAASPSAWMVEAAMDIELGGREATLAVGVQGTGEALASELPETRFLAGLSIALTEQVSLGIEWKRDTDYKAADGGSGESTDALTVLLGAEF